MNTSLLHGLAIALGIGLIVGFERGWTARGQQSGQRLAGVRTFALTGLFGGVIGALSTPDRFVVLAAGTLVAGGLVIGGYALTARATRDFGMTTELALLATFTLGAVAVLGAPFEATAAAVVMALLLGLKAEVHRVLDKLERHEILATLQLLAIAAVLVPLLPSHGVGPWEAIHPRMVGALVLLIAALSYAGYFAVRVLGARLGLLATAFFGGMSSSTAVTVAYARRARESPGAHGLLGAGIALAAATMVPRLGVEIATVNSGLLAELWPTLVVLALVLLAGLGRAAVRTRDAMTADLPLSNPLQLSTAFGFGLLLTAFVIAAAGLQQTLGDTGTYAMAAIAGLFDVDAIGIALADSAARGDLAPITAERAIVTAVLVNTVVKAGLAAALGGPQMLRSASGILIAAFIAAAVTAAVTLS